jgi:hypothetical protein
MFRKLRQPAFWFIDEQWLCGSLIRERLLKDLVLPMGSNKRTGFKTFRLDRRRIEQAVEPILVLVKLELHDSNLALPSGRLVAT